VRETLRFPGVGERTGDEGGGEGKMLRHGGRRLRAAEDHAPGEKGGGPSRRRESEHPLFHTERTNTAGKSPTLDNDRRGAGRN